MPTIFTLSVEGAIRLRALSGVSTLACPERLPEQAAEGLDTYGDGVRSLVILNLFQDLVRLGCAGGGSETSSG